MLKNVNRRVIASLVGFVLGWGVFQFVTPLKTIPAPERPPVEISAITLKRLGCADVELECPVYDVTFRSNGQATFIGYKNNDDYDGHFQALYSKQDFALLAEELQRHRVFEMSSHYGPAEGQEVVIIEVETNEGLRVITSHDWPGTPSDLRVIQAVIDDQSFHVSWSEAE